MKTNLTKQQKERWLKGLSSQKYERCEGELYKGNNDNGKARCCVLGILGMECNVKIFKDPQAAHYRYLTKLLGEDLVNKFYLYNDDYHKSFKWFIGYIKRYIQTRT